MTRNNRKKVGIITLLTFSIPDEIPPTKITTVIRMTARCQGTLPKGPVICAKKVSGSVVINVPMMLPNKVRSTQPTMTE